MKLRAILKPAELPDFFYRLEAKLDKTSSKIGCWLWKGERLRGYGRVAVERGGKRYRFSVHQVMYHRHKGPVGKGKVIDHRCRVRNCTNPKHLEAVTPGENTRRMTAALHGSEPGERCKRGHVGEYQIDKVGKLYCKGCHRDFATARRAKARAAKAKTLKTKATR